MDKSLMLFLGGAVLGTVIAAVALPRAGADLSISSSAKQSTDEQIQKLAEITENLSVTAGTLKNSAETLMSLSVPTAQAQDARKTPQAPQSAAVDTRQPAMNMGMNNNVQAQPAPITEPVQATPMQVDRETEIRGQLAGAANNHAVPLGALIEEANDLTPEQRKLLTDEVMGMIQRGELVPEQFNKRPGS